MTEPEFASLLKTIGGLWPRWGLNAERGQALWSMLGDFTHEATRNAVRRAFDEDPDSTKPPLKRIRSLLHSAVRYETLNERTAREIEAHREHYKGWAHKGWKYPGDDVIRGYIERDEPTPLQKHTLKAMAAAIRSALDRKPLGMTQDEMYGESH